MIKAKEQYRNLYQKMFRAVQNDHEEEANHYRQQMEDLRLSQIAKLNYTPENLTALPSFVQKTLNKSQVEIGRSEASNCINAAFNYHNSDPVFSPLTPMDFLTRVRGEFYQLDSKDGLKVGDLVVFWSRNGDPWKNRKILLADLSPDTPGFPFGLVFDHVAIYVGQNRLYHKPDPTPTSRYQINSWDDIVGFAEVAPGFEMTFHRKLMA